MLDFSVTRHIVELTRTNLHGTFSRDRTPVLTIESGDSVALETLDAGWHTSLEPRNAGWQYGNLFQPRDPVLDAGHALCGPIAISGAEAGMTLEIEILRVDPGPWGWSCGGGGNTELNRRFGVAEGEVESQFWDLDPERMAGRDQHGHEIELRPFLGVIGMPPDEPGIHPTSPPRRSGGNIDCKELVAGSSLFLPVPVSGGLLSVGDGHAVQGDGEVSGVAIECPIERVELRLTLRPEMHIDTPRALTKAAWLTFGFDADLDEGTITATNAMLDLMAERYALTRKEALALASLAVDLRITQIVNGVRGVHAVLPHEALRVPIG